MSEPTNERARWRSSKFEINPSQIGVFGERLVEEELKRSGFDVKSFSLLYSISQCEHVKERIETCWRKGCPIRYLTLEGQYTTMGEKYHCNEYHLTPLRVWSEYPVIEVPPLGQYCHRSLRVCPEVCKPMCRSRRVREIVESAHNKYGVSDLDFLITKDGKEWCVEVKVGESKVEPGQREVMRRIKEEIGIDSVVFRVEMGRAIDYSIKVEKGSDEFLKQLH